jgi:hypothetical protein
MLEGWFKTQPSVKVSDLFNTPQLPTLVTSGLLLHLDAWETTSYPGSGTTWFDISGNSNNVTLVNSPTFTSNYFSFNGTNQTGYVTSPQVNVTGQITVSTWVYFNTYSTNPILVHKGYGYTLYLNNTQGTNAWQWADGSNYSYANFGTRTASGLYQTGVWMNLVVQKNTSNNVLLYRNAQLLDTSAAFGSALTTYSSPTWLNGYSDTTSTPTANFLNGRMSVVSIYNRALTSTEITQNYNVYKSRFGL